MAFAGNKFFVSFSFLDAGNNRSRMRLQMDVADMTAALAAAATLAPLVVAVTKAYVVSYTIEREFDNGDVRVAAGEVEEKALITLALAGVGARKAALAIPAPADTIFVGAPGTDDYNKVDSADPTLTAFTDHFDTGGDLFISDGEHTAGVLKGKRTHRGSTRG